MENVLQNFLKQYNINLNNEKVVVAVSTGIDSMVLLDLLIKSNLNLDIIIAHVNHKKRIQSDSEEEYIKNFSLKNHLKIYVKELSEEEKNCPNFQENARNIRKRFFEEVLHKENSKYLFLAHHLNDDIETILMRIVRGSNLKGYSGIEEFQYNNSYFTLRPLLKTLKDNIVDYAKNNNITYFEDSSNNEDDYTRNRFRHNIVPYLFKENNLLAKNFIDFKNKLLMASKISNEYRDLLIETRFKMLNDNKGFMFNKDEFIKLDYYMQIETLFHLLKDYKLSKDNILELIKQINSSKTNIIFNYKIKNLSLVKEYDNIYCYFYNIQNENIDIDINGEGIYRINDKLEVVVTKNNYKTLPNYKKIWYNSNKLPVKVRTKKIGDVISFNGGTKKVSRVLIDKKVSFINRQNALLLVKDDKVLAIFDYFRSSDLKKTDQDDLIIELREKN